MKHLMLALTFLVGIVIWITPVPDGVTEQAWHLFAIFIATIFGIVTAPLPTGAIAFIGLAAVVLTNTLSFKVAFSGFNNDIVWLIVFAFFVARGFIKTGLGMRISYHFLGLLGKKTLGLGYGLAITDLFLAPAIPSNTARAGGVILPIVESLAKAFRSEPHHPSSDKMGAYLSKVAIQCTCVTSAMFLTSMAANPLIAEIASGFGVKITWFSWFAGAIVPGLFSLIFIPLFLYYLSPPQIKESPHAKALSAERLKEMGNVSRREWIMLITFILLLVLWIFGPEFEILPAVTALLGLVVLLLTGVLTWADIRKEEGAWETLIWFAVLLMMASQLNQLGLTDWISLKLANLVSGYTWQKGLIILSITYYFAHYFFASSLAHVGSMYATFLVIAINMGAPPTLTALLLGYFSSLYSGLTHYASGPSAILFGAGFVKIGDWWKTGFIIGVLNILIWFIVGGLWWKVLGIW